MKDIITVEKDGIVKKISKDIAPDYIAIGWKEVKEKEKSKNSLKDSKGM